MIRNNINFKVLYTLLLFALWIPINAFSAEPINQDSIIIVQHSEKIRKISGVVTDTETENPIPNVIVLIEGLNIGTTTDERGSFTLLLSQEAEAEVKVLLQNYHPISFNINEKMNAAYVQLGKVGESAKGSSVKCYFEVPPEYPGGLQACMQFLAENTKYPIKALKKRIQGRVLVQFIVERDGSIVDTSIFQSAHPLLDAEAIRVVKQMPKWEPGKRDGEPVRVRFTIPVLFKLN